MEISANLSPLQAKKPISYAESDDDDEDAFDPAGILTNKRKGRGKPVIEDDDDEDDVFVGGLDGAADDDDGERPQAPYRI
jgi:DNA mismatch repair protein MSH6